MAFTWKCPYCGNNATITDSNYSTFTNVFDDGNKYDSQSVKCEVTTCPNEECGEYSFKVSIHDRKVVNGSWGESPAKRIWQLLPASESRVFPEYVPKPILADYEEACLIRDLSPKSSATLSRRCLQGMIRDFWCVRMSRLIDEIEAIKDKVDPTTWEAIDSVRKVGNIGAHMEKDINLVVEVDPNEAQILIHLVETLIEDWYVAKYEREQRLAKVIILSKTKEQARKKENKITNNDKNV